MKSRRDRKGLVRGGRGLVKGRAGADNGCVIGGAALLGRMLWCPGEETALVQSVKMG